MDIGARAGVDVVVGGNNCWWHGEGDGFDAAASSG